MRRFIRILAAVVLAGVAAFAGFFFWSSGGALTPGFYETGEVIRVPTLDEGNADGDYTIVTYNVGYASGMTNNTANNASAEEYADNLGRIADALEAMSPDIVAFQEIDYGSDRSYQRDQLPALGDALRLPYRARSFNWDKRYLPFPYWPLSAHYGRMLSGQAIVSAFPIESHEKTTLAKPSSNPGYYNAYYIDRLIERADITIGDETLTVLNVHLEAYDRPTREGQAEVVAAIAAECAIEGPVILLGDFNATPPWEDDSDETMPIILDRTRFTMAISEAAYTENPDAQYSFSSANPFQSIDHILYSEHIEALDARVLRDAGTGSDHLPIMMRFRFADDGPAESR